MSTDTTESDGSGAREGGGGPTATVGRLLESLRDSASVRAVYGEPIVAGDRTVVPVARIRYGFGGGYGEGGAGAGDEEATRAAGEEESEDAGSGAGFGGGVDATPLGVVELDATGTRLVRFDDRRRLAGLALALAVGYVLGRRARG